jgi:hypothetical protein
MWDHPHDDLPILYQERKLIVLRTQVKNAS